MKKKYQNGKRSKTPDPTPESQEAAELELDEGMVKQIQLQTSLIEGRKVSRVETLELLKRTVRQRSLAAETRREYVLRFLTEREENPP